jgi:TolB-like protein/DNA-binding winged helix-turn-helix (wHTH) protein/Flp pilus assembly protein TadD
LYEFGDFRLDTHERQLLRNGQPVPLTPKAFETLVLLVERSGRLVRKDELIQALWPDSFVEEANLTNNIWALRTALGERHSQKYIETVPKGGYRFVADVRPVADVAGTDVIISRQETGTTKLHAVELPNAVANDSNNNSLRLVTDQLLTYPSSQAPFLIRQIKLHKAGVGLAAGIVLAAAIGITFWYRNTATSKPEVTAIAVLPFVNASKNPEAEYLSDGVTESLINNLSQLPNLKVIARSSSFKYKGKEVDLEDVWRSLGVEAVLMGRVVQRGEDLLISVELIDTRDKTQMWGEQYNRKASDLLQVQSEISREIAEKLRLRLTVGQMQQLAKQQTAKPEAYELLLKGRFHWTKSGTENRKKAVEYYQRAITLDPSYALAYAEVSFSYSWLSSIGDLNPKEFIPEAEAAAQKALALDENLAEAHLALGVIKLDKWDWTAAERELKRAIELNANLASTREMYSLYLSLMSRHREAIAEARRERELDPLSPSANFGLAYKLLLARQNDQAIEAARKILELAPNYPDGYFIFGYAYAAKGQFRDAIAAYEQAIKLGDNSPDTQVYLGVAYAKAGEQAKARVILKQLEGNANTSPTTLAAFYLALNKTEQAFASLERAYAAHDSQLQFLAVDSNFDPLRSDPRFQQLMRRVGLPQ